METRSVETTSFDSASIPLDGIRWPAVFAGLAVGLGVHMLLMLFGGAAGFTVHDAEGRNLPVAAAVWNTISMVIAALIGGYVAARASGLRRNVDGMINGVAAWGAAMLIFSVLTGSVSESAINSMFGVTASPPVAARSTDSALLGQLMSSVERGDRETTMNILQDRFGLSQEQAGLAADHAMAVTGLAAGPDDARSEASGVIQTASAASAWLSVMIVLSLFAGAGGGLLGARGARQRALHGRYDEQRVVVRHSHDIPLTG